MAARAVAREPARALQELDKGEPGSGTLAPAQVDDVPVAPDRKAAYVQLDEPPAGELERARITRDHGQGEARFHRAPDRSVRAEVHGDVELRPRLARSLLERPAAARRRLAHHEGLMFEVLHVESVAASQLVARRGGDDELIAHERQEGQIRIL